MLNKGQIAQMALAKKRLLECLSEVGIFRVEDSSTHQVTKRNQEKSTKIPYVPYVPYILGFCRITARVFRGNARKYRVK